MFETRDIRRNCLVELFLFFRPSITVFPIVNNLSEARKKTSGKKGEKRKKNNKND